MMMMKNQKMQNNNKIIRQFLLPLICSVLVLAFGDANAREMTDFPVVKLKSLDKITARTETFEARVGSTVQFGPLFIKVQACRKSDPIEEPESAAFLQIWEIDTEEKAQWVFSGWMFASSPALSPMDHALYDVWVLDCQEDQAKEKKNDELPEGAIPSEPQEDAIADPVPEESPAEESSDAPNESDVD